MLDKNENENEFIEIDIDDGFDKDEAVVLKHALVAFNKDTGLEWTMSDLDFIVSFPGPLTISWYDKFNTYVVDTIKEIEEGKITL